MTSPLEQAEAILKAAEEATPGEWCYASYGRENLYAVGVAFGDYDQPLSGLVTAEEYTVAEPVAVDIYGAANARFIALARNTAPAISLALIEKHRALERAERALLRAVFQDLGGEEWKPPLGPAPRFIEVPALSLPQQGDAALFSRVEMLEEDAGRWQRSVRECEANPEMGDVACVSHLALMDAEREIARMKSALEYIAAHSNECLTDYSKSTRICIDELVRRAAAALNG